MKKLLLSPLLAAQAAFVIAKAERLPEPDGPRQGQLGDGQPLRLLILGDSSAAGVGAQHQSAALSGQLTARLAKRFSLTWQLEAKTGATTASTLKRVEALPEARFDQCFIALGVNDVTRMTSASAFARRQSALHARLKQKFGITRIIASGLPPMGHFPLLPQPLRSTLGRDAARLDATLAQICAGDTALTHLPLDLPFEPKYVARDGFHPSEAAYAVWAEMIVPHLAGQA